MTHRERWVREVGKGQSLSSIADEMGMGRDTLWRALRSKRPRHRTLAQVQGWLKSHGHQVSETELLW